MTWPDPFNAIRENIDANAPGVIQELGNNGIIPAAGYNKISVNAVATEQAASAWVLTVEGANVLEESAFVSLATLSGETAASLFTSTISNKSAFVRVNRTTAADARIAVGVHGWHE